MAPLRNHCVLLDQSNISIHMEWYKNPWICSVKEISVQPVHQNSTLKIFVSLKLDLCRHSAGIIIPVIHHFLVFVHMRLFQYFFSSRNVYICVHSHIQKAPHSHSITDTAIIEYTLYYCNQSVISSLASTLSYLGSVDSGLLGRYIMQHII